MNPKNFPGCIYLDTNVMRDLGLGASNSSYLELKKWVDEFHIPIVIPEVVALEWFQLHKEKVKSKSDQTASNLVDLEALLGEKQVKFELPQNHASMLVKALDNKLSDLGIKISDTPKNISINQLVGMAVFKTRPFEEKGEKGFRDTIILYTLLEDMKKRGCASALFITNDRIFEHDDVKAKIRKDKVSVDLAPTFEDASKHLRGILDERVEQIVEMRNRRLFEFVKSNSAAIFQYVKDKAEISEDFITKGGLLSTKTEIFGQIEKVVSFEPVSIENAFRELEAVRDKNSYPKDMEPVIISVGAKLKVVYSPLLVFNRPRVKIQDLDRFREVINSTPVQYYGDPVETELNRKVSVSALLKRDSEGEFVDIVLERVNTF